MQMVTGGKNSSVDDPKIGEDEDDEGWEESCDKDNYNKPAVNHPFETCFVQAKEGVEPSYRNNAIYLGRKNCGAGITSGGCNSNDIDILNNNDNIQP